MDTFTNKLDKILSFFSSPNEEKTLIKADLLAALYMELTNRMAEKMKSLNLDPNEEVNQAGKAILDNFAKELETKIPAKQLSQIKALI